MSEQKKVTPEQFMSKYSDIEPIDDDEIEFAKIVGISDDWEQLTFDLEGFNGAR